jgi:arsenate reductase
MLTIYGIPNCNTVKKARTWLEENGVEYIFHDYKKKGITAEKIQGWYKDFPWAKLVNKAGTTWKALSDEDKAAVQDGESAIALMIEKNSVIKRPVVEDASGRAVALGFSEKEFEDKFLR